MNEYKEQAIDILNRLHEEGRINGGDYYAIHEGLSVIECLRDRDGALEDLWEQFKDVPMNPQTECIEERFMGWGPGIHREEIWQWFDARHSKGVAYLLYGNAVERTPETAKLLYQKRLCFAYQSSDCRFNCNGECRFPLVHGRKPHFNNQGVCTDCIRNGSKEKRGGHER